MDEFEKLDAIQTLTGETDAKVLLTFLRLAEEKIKNIVYPYGSEGKEFPSQYDGKSIEIAAWMLNKRGAEGQLSHNENGVYRTYESADIPVSLLRGVVPYVGVIG